MGVIRELPASVINQIAAGEVVERPASVVKELLENAVDAGARRIELTVERGGKDLVRVADDGRGMAADDLPLAFRPHATSKLATAEDLTRIATLGFRGEALAAVAEISRVRCQSRYAGAEGAAEIVVEGGVAQPIRQVGGPPGTVIEVRNLFHNTPVRRTFLKSDQTEAGHVAEVFIRIALAHPGVHFTYRSAGKVVHDLPPVSGMKPRIALLLGKELADSLLWIESRLDGISISGYVGHPSHSRTTAKGQYLFISGRYVRDRSLSHALSEAYRGLLMVGRSPVAFLDLDLPPEEVDVNVHPSKIEVRFRDSNRIYSQLLATVRETFLTGDLSTSLQVVGRPSAPVSDATEEPVRPDRQERLPGISSADRALSPLQGDPFNLREGDDARQVVASWFQPSTPTNVGPTGPLPPLPPKPEPAWAVNLPPATGREAVSFDEFGTEPPGAEEPQPRSVSPPPGARRAMQVHDSYLIAETEEGVVLIDQHALHERILYEELRGRLARLGIESQRLLVPEPVDLGLDGAAALLERRETLGRLGLEVDEFGSGTVVVRAVPSLLGKVRVDLLVRDLADHFRTKPLPPTPDGLLQDVMSLIACKAAVKAGQRLAEEEVSALLARRHLVDDAHHCPHGRPTALVFTKDELEKQFGRI